MQPEQANAKKRRGKRKYLCGSDSDEEEVNQRKRQRLQPRTQTDGESDEDDSANDLDETSSNKPDEESGQLLVSMPAPLTTLEMRRRDAYRTACSRYTKYLTCTIVPEEPPEQPACVFCLGSSTSWQPSFVGDCGHEFHYTCFVNAKIALAYMCPYCQTNLQEDLPADISATYDHLEAEQRELKKVGSTKDNQNQMPPSYMPLTPPAKGHPNSSADYPTPPSQPPPVVSNAPEAQVPLSNEEASESGAGSLPMHGGSIQVNFVPENSSVHSNSDGDEGSQMPSPTPVAEDAAVGISLGILNKVPPHPPTGDSGDQQSSSGTVPAASADTGDSAHDNGDLDKPGPQTGSTGTASPDLPDGNEVPSQLTAEKSSVDQQPQSPHANQQQAGEVVHNNGNLGNSSPPAPQNDSTETASASPPNGDNASNRTAAEESSVEQESQTSNAEESQLRDDVHGDGHLDTGPPSNPQNDSTETAASPNPSDADNLKVSSQPAAEGSSVDREPQSSNAEAPHPNDGTNAQSGDTDSEQPGTPPPVQSSSTGTSEDEQTDPPKDTDAEANDDGKGDAATASSAQVSDADADDSDEGDAATDSSAQASDAADAEKPDQPPQPEEASTTGGDTVAVQTQTGETSSSEGTSKDPEADEAQTPDVSANEDGANTDEHSVELPARTSEDLPASVVEKQSAPPAPESGVEAQMQPPDTDTTTTPDLDSTQNADDAQSDGEGGSSGERQSTSPSRNDQQSANPDAPSKTPAPPESEVQQPSEDTVPKAGTNGDAGATAAIGGTASDSNGDATEKQALPNTMQSAANTTASSDDEDGDSDPVHSTIGWSDFVSADYLQFTDKYHLVLSDVVKSLNITPEGKILEKHLADAKKVVDFLCTPSFLFTSMVHFAREPPMPTKKGTDPSVAAKENLIRLVERSQQRRHLLCEFAAALAVSAQHAEEMKRIKASGNKTKPSEQAFEAMSSYLWRSTGEAVSKFVGWARQQNTLANKLLALAGKTARYNKELDAGMGDGIWVLFGISVETGVFNLTQPFKLWLTSEKAMKIVAHCIRTYHDDKSLMRMLGRACEGMFDDVTYQLDPHVQLRAWRLIVLRVFKSVPTITRLLPNHDMTALEELSWLPACRITSGGLKLPEHTIAAFSNNGPLTLKMVHVVWKRLVEDHSSPSCSPEMFQPIVFRPHTSSLSDALERVQPETFVDGTGLLIPVLIPILVLEGTEESEDPRDLDHWLLADVRDDRAKCFYFKDDDSFYVGDVQHYLRKWAKKYTQTRLKWSMRRR